MRKADMETFSDLKLDLYRWLSLAEKDLVAARLRRRELEKGEKLFQIGDHAAGVFYVVSGQFAVKKFTGFEEKMQVVALLSSGAVIGENGILENHRRTATVVAVEQCEVVELSRDHYEAIKNESPELALKLVEYSIKISGLRLDACTARLAHIL